MPGLMQVELQTTCSALGYQEGDVYHKEPDCLETVKDLIRFLKREDESCEIRRQLGGAQIVQNDLVPLLKQYSDDRILWETIVRLLVNLTQPAVLCFQNHVPEDKTYRNYYLEIESQLQAYKESFADDNLFAVITKKLGDLLQLDWEKRQEEDRLLIERILILIRNILHVPPNIGRDQRTDDDASVHDQVLWALHVSGMEDLLLYLASSDAERQFAFHVLEIIALMFREQTPEQLASAGVQRSLSEREKDERELAMLREEEKAKKKAMVQKYSSRHSRFGGAFVVSNLKSISEREVITHRPIKDIKDMTFDKNKVPKRKPKNRKPLNEEEYTRRSTLSIRVFLKEFCIQFLESCYNPLMSAVKDTLMRAGAQENDETYYLWTMRFFMEFQRRHNFKVDLVGETMSVQAFHYVQTNMTNYHEMLLTNKKEALIWSRRMHLALRAYYELLQSLNAMDHSKEHHIKESAKIIKSNVFYMMEYRDVFLTLLKKFDETRQSRGFLRDLVDATHLFLKMLEMHCTKTGHMVVQKKKKRKKAGKKKAKPAPAGQTTLSAAELDDLWDEVSGDLSAIFQGRVQVPTDILPFDAASQIDVEQQKAEAMSRIQEAMRGHRAGEAVALLRAAREVWPENDRFGRADISPEDEFMALREVFMAELPRSQVAMEEQNEPHEDEEDEDDDEELAAHYDTVDEQFNFKEFVGRFSSPHIVRAYTVLLNNYRRNSPQTNHAIVKMFHRIGFDTGIIGMLFQAALFRVFMKILNDPAAKTSHYKEILKFIIHVVRKFFEAAAANPKIYVELFFLKNVKESIEIVEGYGSTRESVKGKVAWSEEQEQELRDLWERFEHHEEEGQDSVDLILTQLTDSTKTRRQVILALVHLGLISSAKDLKKHKSGAGRARGWREEEELELKSLFDEHRETEDPLANIIEAMTNKRSKPLIKKKLLEMGLVSDMKELRKKRASKSGRRGKSRDPWGDEGEMDDGLPDFSSDSDNEQPAPSKSKSSGKARSGSKNPWGPAGEEDDNLPSFSSESDSDKSVTGGKSGGSDGGESEDDNAPNYVRNIKKAAKKVYQKKKHAAIEWLKTNLEGVAEDREEDDDDEPIPLVPLTEEQEDAMEDKDFVTLLKKIGVKKPANEQERFWRVPGSLTPADLRSRAEALRPPVAGEEDDDEDDTSSDRKEKKGKDKKSGGRLAALKAMVKQKKETAKKNAKSDGSGKRSSKFRGEKSAPMVEQPPVVAAQDSDSDVSMSQGSGSGLSQSQGQSQSGHSQSPTGSSRSKNPLSQSQTDPSQSQSGSSQSQLGSSQSQSGSSQGQAGSSQSGNSSPTKKPRSNKKRIRRTGASDYSDDSDDDRLVINDETSRDSMPRSKRLRLTVSDDSEEDNDKRPLSVTANHKAVESDSDSDDEPLVKKAAPESFPATMLSQEPDSDSDVDDHVPLRRGVKRAALIDSDDD